MSANPLKKPRNPLLLILSRCSDSPGVLFPIPTFCSNFLFQLSVPTSRKPQSDLLARSVRPPERNIPEEPHRSETAPVCPQCCSWHDLFEFCSCLSERKKRLSNHTYRTTR